MSRRARSKSKSGGRGGNGFNAIPIIIGMAVALTIVAAFIIIPKIIAPDGGSAAPMDVNSYVGGSKTHAGNSYELIGKIRKKEPFGNGEFLLEVQSESNGKEGPIVGIFVSKEINDKFPDLNLDSGSTYVFIVNISNKSFPEAEYIRSK